MAGDTALLVVHGIGAQKPGETLAKLIKGLRATDAEVVRQDDRTAALIVGGRRVRLYEVYWADLLMGEVTHRTFLMNELQSLSWFPLLNARRGNYPRGSYSGVKLAWWCLVLPIVNFFVLFAYYGAGLFAQILRGDDDARGGSASYGRRASLTAVDTLLDEYAGDVFSYVNSAGRAFYREKDEPPVPTAVERAYPQIVQRFYDRLVDAQADGCESIQIVAHSLGTVVTYHALSEFGIDPLRADLQTIRAAKAKVRRLYTIGSPLEKIRFFWPRVLPRRGQANGMNLRWDNFVSRFDPVAGMLRSFDDWGPVTNHRLVGGGFFLGHVVYEHSGVFLSAVTEGLCGRAIPLRRGFAARLSDVLTLTGEMLLEPLLVATVVGVGFLLYLTVAMLLPFLFSLPVRWVLPPETWSPYVDAAAAVFLAMMTLAFLVAPAVRAKRAHAHHWTAPFT